MLFFNITNGDSYLFFISLTLVLISTFFITAVLSRNSKSNLFLIYFFILGFAQIVLSFEVLSLLNLIRTKEFLCINGVFFLFSFCFWLFKEKPIPKLNLFDELFKIKIALKLDKTLFILSVLFILFIFVKLLNIFVLPPSWGDALVYYFPRCLSWIYNGSINHYVVPDVRELIMPVNMDFLYTWLFLFFKNARATAIFSFISYIGGLIVIYNLLGYFNVIIRRRLWSIYVFSAFSLIGSLLQSPCADIFIGSLILSSVYLFVVYAKENNKTALYISTLSYVLAIGTKTTALLVSPAVFLLFFIVLLKYKRNKFIKESFVFLFLMFINFIIFASYNYILNFIQFLHPISNLTHVLLNKFFGGINGYIFNLTKYIFVLFDASGIDNFHFYNEFITSIQQKFLSLFGMNATSYLSPYYPDDYVFDSKVSPLNGYLGLIGLFSLVPSIFISVKRLIQRRFYDKNLVINLLGFLYVLNILLFSGVMFFTSFNMRYLITFVVISSPALIYSYVYSFKNIYKLIVTALVAFYLFSFPIANELPYLIYVLKNPNIRSWKNITRDEISIANYLKKNNYRKVLLYISGKHISCFDIEKLKLDGFKIDKLLLENLESYDISNYDYIITDEYEFSSSNLLYIPNKFCVYLDSNKNIVEYNKKSEIVKAKCKIPFEYFKEQGFIDDSYSINGLSSFKLFKNKKYTLE